MSQRVHLFRRYRRYGTLALAAVLLLAPAMVPAAGATTRAEARQALERLNTLLARHDYQVIDGTGIFQEQWRNGYRLRLRGTTLVIHFENEVNVEKHQRQLRHYVEAGRYRMALADLDPAAFRAAENGDGVVLVCRNGSACIEQVYSEERVSADGERGEDQGSRWRDELILDLPPAPGLAQQALDDFFLLADAYAPVSGTTTVGAVTGGDQTTTASDRRHDEKEKDKRKNKKNKKKQKKNHGRDDDHGRR